MKKKIRIVEVGPRDGLQNERLPIPLEKKLAFVEALFSAGVEELELTSFVKADKIPQLADAVELTQEIKRRGYLKKCWFLVPNVHGAEVALKLGVSRVAFFTSPSETFNQKNINCSVAESLQKIGQAMRVFKGSKVYFRGYLSMVFGCPYEGEIAKKKVLDLSNKLLALGIDELSMGDTIGVASPNAVASMVTSLKKIIKLKNLAMHFHDTRGIALANIYESLKLGITAFDSSAGGLGGCPYAKGATGNVATEDLVYLLQQQGYSTSINLSKLYQAGELIYQLLNKSSTSKMHQFLSRSNT